MKQGRSLQDLAREVERQREAKRDFVVPSSAMSITTFNFRGDGIIPQVMLDLEEDAEVFQPTSHFHGQVAGRLGIPRRYYRRMLEEAPRLLADNVNHWLQESEDLRLVRTMDGQARAYLSDRYRLLDHDLVMGAALEGLSDVETEVRVESCEVTDRRLYLKIVFPELGGEVVGDPVSGAVYISNSEIGQGSVSVQPAVYVLACANGMVVPERGLKRRHVGRAFDEVGPLVDLMDDTIRAGNEEFRLRLRDTIHSCTQEEQFRVLLGMLEEAAEDEITARPTAAVEVARGELGLTEDEGEGVLEHLIRGGDLSRWGLSQAITREAQDVESYDRSTELEEIGGRVIEMPRESWRSIAEAA